MADTPRVTAILGATGTGKTYLLRKLLDKYPRVFLLDPTDDEKFDDFAPVVTYAEAAGESRNKRFRIRLVADSPLALEGVCKAAFLHLHNCVIAIDEIQEFVPSSHFSIIRTNPWFRKCVLRGRHCGISLIGSSQRPANVHKDFISQAGITYLFRSEVEDLGWLKRYKHLHAAPYLRVGEFLTWPLADVRTAAER